MATSVTRRVVKPGYDLKNAKLVREVVSVSLAKEKRGEQLAKRRQRLDGKKGEEAETFAATAPDDWLDKVKKIPGFVAGINSDETEIQLKNIVKLRELISDENKPPIQEVINTNIIPRLVHLLARGPDDVQFEAAWVLINLCSGTKEQTQHVINAGAIPLFVHALGHAAGKVREQCVWALGNISGDCPEHRDIVIKHGGVQALLMLFSDNLNVTTLRNLTWTLSNLCRGKPFPPFEVIRHVLPTLSKLLSTTDVEVLSDTCWAYSYVSDDKGMCVRTCVV